jgi:hypothetical protein
LPQVQEHGGCSGRPWAACRRPDPRPQHPSRPEPRFEYLGAIIRCYTSFPSFLKVRDDLILKELHLDSSSPPVDATTLYTSPAPAAAMPPAPTPAPPSRPPSNGGTGNKGKKKKNAGGDRGHGGNSRNTTLTPPAPTSRFPPPGQPTLTRGRGTSPCTLAHFWVASSTRRP